MSDKCIWCRADLHFQCEIDSTNCCCQKADDEVTAGIAEDEIFLNETEKRSVGRPRKDSIGVESGRRRAGLIAKIPDGYICEWAKLEFAGGGVRPIIGCNGNVAEALHHGPDKSTINNEVGINLHRVCHKCHNRWHELNDEFYGTRPADNGPYLPTVDFLPHNRLDQTDRLNIARSDKWWETPKSERTDEYRSWERPRTVANVPGNHESDSAGFDRLF